MSSRWCPDQCPLCLADLKGDGYPVVHQHADTGEVCAFEWDTAGALQAELAEESAEELAAFAVMELAVRAEADPFEVRGVQDR